MPNANVAIVMGHITRDPEIRFTPKGTEVCDFSLGVSERWTDDNGQKQEKTVFVECQAWGNSAKILGDYVKRGHPVHVIGKVDQDTWDDKETGKKRYKTYVRVQSLQLIRSKPESERAEPPPRDERKSEPPRKPVPPRDPDLDPTDSDDVPF